MAAKPVSVSQLNSYIKRILQTDPILGNVSVTGEISNLKFHNSGHVYFSLKDESSRIDCFLPAGNLYSLDFQMKEGMEVTAYGYVYLYEKGGRYSLNVRTMDNAGQGELAIAFEKLKKKLENEGLFDKSHKKEIPPFPEKIAVVTSPVGAAVRDVLKIIRSRNTYVDVLIYPVIVQGPKAAGEIAAAIDDINISYPDVDVIITGRGGGSMEELMAFNDEGVARSIYRSDIPVISAVGHETDFTIADFVADVRAETPTQAAHLAVPDTFMLKDHIDEMKLEMNRNLRMLTEYRRKHLETLNPNSFVRDIQGRIALEHMTADNIISNMGNRLQDILSSYRSMIDVMKETLEAANPQLVLERGYCVVTDENGGVVRDTSVLQKGRNVSIKAARGQASAQVLEIRKE